MRNDFPNFTHAKSISSFLLVLHRTIAIAIAIAISIISAHNGNGAPNNHVKLV